MFLAREVVPEGGGIGAVVKVLQTPGKWHGHIRRANLEYDAALKAVRSADPRLAGQGDELIAAYILAHLVKLGKKVPP